MTCKSIVCVLLVAWILQLRAVAQTTAPMTTAPITTGFQTTTERNTEETTTTVTATTTSASETTTTEVTTTVQEATTTTAQETTTTTASQEVTTTSAVTTTTEATTTTTTMTPSSGPAITTSEPTNLFTIQFLPYADGNDRPSESDFIDDVENGFRVYLNVADWNSIRVTFLNFTTSCAPGGNCVSWALVRITGTNATMCAAKLAELPTSATVEALHLKSFTVGDEIPKTSPPTEPTGNSAVIYYIVFGVVGGAALLTLIAIGISISAKRAAMERMATGRYGPDYFAMEEDADRRVPTPQRSLLKA